MTRKIRMKPISLSTLRVLRVPARTRQTADRAYMREIEARHKQGLVALPRMAMQAAVKVAYAHGLRDGRKS